MEHRIGAALGALMHTGVPKGKHALQSKVNAGIYTGGVRADGYSDFPSERFSSFSTSSAM